MGDSTRLKIERHGTRRLVQLSLDRRTSHYLVGGERDMRRCPPKPLNKFFVGNKRNIGGNDAGGNDDGAGSQRRIETSREPEAD